MQDLVSNASYYVLSIEDLWVLLQAESLTCFPPALNLCKVEYHLSSNTAHKCSDMSQETHHRPLVNLQHLGVL